MGCNILSNKATKLIEVCVQKLCYLQVVEYFCVKYFTGERNQTIALGWKIGNCSNPNVI